MLTDFINIDHPVRTNNTAFCLLDKYPVAEGHSLVCPKRCVSSILCLSPEERHDLIDLVVDRLHELTQLYSPDGYTVGLNLGVAAGQTVARVHVHIIPRFFDDCAEPQGGVRGVVPDKKTYDRGWDEGKGEQE